MSESDLMTEVTDTPQGPGGDGVDTDFVDYFLTNNGLPGEDDPHPLEFKIGDGARARKNVWQVRTIGWAEWQDARERATDDDTGAFDAFVSSSYVVARALVEPRLGPKVSRAQKENGKHAPRDAAELLRRMFRKQSGVLLELSAEVLAISKLAQSDKPSVRGDFFGDPKRVAAVVEEQVDRALADFGSGGGKVATIGELLTVEVNFGPSPETPDVELLAACVVRSLEGVGLLEIYKSAAGLECVRLPGGGGVVFERPAASAVTDALRDFRLAKLKLMRREAAASDGSGGT